MPADLTETPSASHKYRRVLLKLSGEALMGDQSYGLDPKIIGRIAQEVKSVNRLGVQIAIVIGGGNIFRGLSPAARGMERASADYMGMLATVMNALALQDALEKIHVATRVLTSFTIDVSGATVPNFSHRLVWAVIAHHVPFLSSQLHSGSTTTTSDAPSTSNVP